VSGGITLECAAEVYPAPLISWVKDKVVIKSVSGSLQFMNLKLNDIGVYECWANNSNGFDARLYKLEVTSGLNFSPSLAKIFLSSPSCSSYMY
jgi:hypothetical protein